MEIDLNAAMKYFLGLVESAGETKLLPAHVEAKADESVTTGNHLAPSDQFVDFANIDDAALTLLHRLGPPRAQGGSRWSRPIISSTGPNPYSTFIPSYDLSRSVHPQSFYDAELAAALARIKRGLELPFPIWGFSQATEAASRKADDNGSSLLRQALEASVKQEELKFAAGSPNKDTVAACSTGPYPLFPGPTKENLSGPHKLGWTSGLPTDWDGILTGASVLAIMFGEPTMPAKPSGLMDGGFDELAATIEARHPEIRVLRDDEMAAATDFQRSDFVAGVDFGHATELLTNPTPMQLETIRMVAQSFLAKDELSGQQLSFEKRLNQLFESSNPPSNPPLMEPAGLLTSPPFALSIVPTLGVVIGTPFMQFELQFTTFKTQPVANERLVAPADSTPLAIVEDIARDTSDTALVPEDRIVAEEPTIAAPNTQLFNSAAVIASGAPFMPGFGSAMSAGMLRM